MKNKIFIFICILMTVGCDKGFEELNVTPDKPEVADVRAVYNGISGAYRSIGTEQAFLRNEILLPQTQLTGLSRKLGVDAIARTRGSIWNNYYGTLKNIVYLEGELEAENNFNTTNAKALLKIAKSFATLKITDLYGDMPYSEGGKGFLSGSAQIIRPVYDDSKSIYMASLEDLKWASDNIILTEDETFLSFGSTDSYYQGNMDKWRKMANTLQLRYAMRASEKDEALASTIVGDILNGNKPLIEEITDDLIYNRIAANDTDHLQGAFRAAGSNGVRMGETIWNFMSDSDAVDGSGIFDPRLYIYFEPNGEANEWVPVSQDFNGGITPPDNSDVYAGIGPVPDNHYSPVNKNFVFATTNRVPIVTSSEAYFLKAEAYARGIGVTKDMAKAEENYYKGIRASVDYWYDVVANDLETFVYPTAINIPPTTTEMDDFLNHPKVAFTGTDEEKLDKIYGQRWASLFWLPEEAHFLQSRTARTPLTGSRDNFYRMPYPETEEANNKANYDAAVSKMGGNGFDIKLWWMK